MRPTRNVAAVLAMLLLSGCGSTWLLRLVPATDPRIGQAPMDATSKSQVRAYFDLPSPKAFAFSPERGTNRHTWGFESVEAAKQVAMNQCEGYSRTRCVLFAVNDEIVWRPSDGEAATKGQEAAGNGVYLVGIFDNRGDRRTLLQVVNPTRAELRLFAILLGERGTPLRCYSSRLPAGGLAEVDVRKTGVKALVGVVKIVALADDGTRPVAGLVGSRRLTFNDQVLIETGLHSVQMPLPRDELLAIGRLCSW